MPGWETGDAIMSELADLREERRAAPEADPERAALEARLAELQAEVAEERSKRPAEPAPLPLLPPAESPEQWTARMRMEAALAQAVQLAINRPDLVRPSDNLEGADRAIDLAQKVASMAKVFDTLLKGG